jgi:hypothetical protein
MQKAIACAAGILIASAVAAGQSTSPSYSHAELKKMIGEAHSAEQYEILAIYFRSQAKCYKQKAAEEKQELWRRLQVDAALYQKYPRPVDSSRNRYEYFAYEAQLMNMQASRYEEQAASAQQ